MSRTTWPDHEWQSATGFIIKSKSLTLQPSTSNRLSAATVPKGHVGIKGRQKAKGGDNQDGRVDGRWLWYGVHCWAVADNNESPFFKLSAISIVVRRVHLSRFMVNIMFILAVSCGRSILVGGGSRQCSVPLETSFNASHHHCPQCYDPPVWMDKRHRSAETTFHLVSSIKGKIRPSRITHCIRILRNLFIPGGWWVVEGTCTAHNLVGDWNNTWATYQQSTPEWRTCKNTVFHWHN